MAANFGDLEMLNLLLNVGANIEAQDQKGRTPLLIADATDNLKVVKLLLDRDATRRPGSCKGQTTLMRACRLGFLEITVALVANGADSMLSTVPDALHSSLRPLQIPALVSVMGR